MASTEIRFQMNVRALASPTQIFWFTPSHWWIRGITYLLLGVARGVRNYPLGVVIRGFAAKSLAELVRYAVRAKVLEPYERNVSGAALAPWASRGRRRGKGHEYLSFAAAHNWP
jgi:hypothetical protein